MRKLIVIFLFFSVTQAHAAVWFQTGLSLTSSQDVPNANTENTDLRFVSATTLGWKFLQGFLLGTQFLVSRSTLSQDYAWAIGPKGGLLIGGFEATGTYIPLSKAQRGAAGVLSGGGFSLNLGYHFQVVQGFRMGLEILYWYGLFDQPGPDKYKSTQITPMVSFALDL
jgi:hypothetical protein